MQMHGWILLWVSYLFALIFSNISVTDTKIIEIACRVARWWLLRCSGVLVRACVAQKEFHLVVLHASFNTKCIVTCLYTKESFWNNAMECNENVILIDILYVVSSVHHHHHREFILTSPVLLSFCIPFKFGLLVSLYTLVKIYL